VLPGDTVHAGGFCFGGKEAHLSSVPRKEILVQNGHFYFNLCCSQLAHDDINEEVTITIVGDSEPPFLEILILMRLFCRVTFSLCWIVM